VQILAGSDQPDAAGRLLAALVLTRIPLYMFQAVQAALVPGLAASVSANDTGAFRSSVLRLLAMIAGLTAVALVAVLIAGPEALRTLFGPGFVLGRMDLCLLTLASSTLMAAQACGAALVSVHRHAKSSLGWALGVLAFVLACFWQGPLLARVELALLAGAVVSAVVLALTLGQTMRRHRA
jgi:O-antigen/teichoic acid export membrane protein